MPPRQDLPNALACEGRTPDHPGALVLSNNVSVSVSGDDLGDAVNRLRQRIALQTGWTLQPQAEKPDKSTIRIAIAKR